MALVGDDGHYGFLAVRYTHSRAAALGTGMQSSCANGLYRDISYCRYFFLEIAVFGYVFTSRLCATDSVC